MAVDLFLGYFAYTATIFISFIGTYFFLSIFNTNARAPGIDEALKRDILVMFQDLINQTLNTIIQPIQEAWAALVNYIQLLIQNWKIIVLMGIILVCAIIMHFEHDDFMSAIDQAWRCSIYALFHDIISPIIQIIRLVYAIIAPIVNLVTVIWYQATLGTEIIFIKCSMATVFDPIPHIAQAIVEFVLSFMSWLGIDQLPISTENNFAVNDFVVAPAVKEIALAVSSLKSSFQCSCEGLDPIWSILFAVVEAKHFPFYIDHVFQLIIRIFQAVWKIIIPPQEFPRFDRILYHAQGALIECAMWADEVIGITVKNLVIQFGGGAWDENTVQFPEEFIFSAVGRAALTAMQYSTTFALKGPIKMFTTGDIGDMNTLIQIWNVDDAFSNLYKANYNMWNSVHWVIYAIENVIKGLVTAGTGFTPQPVVLSCNWEEDLEGENYKQWPHSPHMVSYTIACAGEAAGRAGIGTTIWSLSLAQEVFFKCIIQQEQNFLRLIQKYDGVWTNRNELNTCERRKARALPVGENGKWREDWTINADVCQCDMDLGFYTEPDPNHPDYSESTFDNLDIPYKFRTRKRAPVYNPWCGQPTLQDQILAPMEDALIYTTHGIFGPTGIGELLQARKLSDTKEDLKNAKLVVEALQVVQDKGKQSFEGGSGPEDSPAAELEPSGGEAEEEEAEGDDEGSEVPDSNAAAEGEEGDEADTEKLEDAGGSSSTTFCCPTPKINAKSFDFKKFIKPYTRQQLETFRIMVKMFLSLVDIFTMRFLWYDMNCGYGLNKTALHRRWRIVYPEYEEQEGNTPIEELEDNELRWDICKERAYKFPGAINTAQANVNMDNYKLEQKWCKGTNDNSDCVCNPVLDLDISHPCQCIPFPPKVSDIMDDTPLAEFIVNNQIQKSTKRWCGSMIEEWHFQNIGQFADAVAWMASFGPWNKDCVPARMMSADTDLSAYYILGHTRTTDKITAGPNPSCDAFANIEVSSYAQVGEASIPMLTTQCSSMGVKDGATALIEDASTKGSCVLWANDNIFCNLGMMARTFFSIDISVKRKATRMMKLMLGLNFFDWDLNFMPEMCSKEKIYAQVASSAASILTFGQGSRGVRKALGKLMFAWMIYADRYTKIMIACFNFLIDLLGILKMIAAGLTKDVSAVGRGFSEAIGNLINGILGQVLDGIVLIIRAFGDFFESLIEGASVPFEAVAIIVEIIAKALLGTLLDFIQIIFDFLAKFFGVFSGTTSVGEFLVAFFDLLNNIVMMLLQNAMKLMVAILRMLGPIGEFIVYLANAFCQGLNTVVCTISAGTKCPPNNAMMECPTLYSPRHDLPRLMRHHPHFKTTNGDDPVKWISENIEWNGTSKCDLYMEGLRFTNYTDLRPLEKAEWYSCLEQRAIGQHIEEVLELHDFKFHDILYNYHRKYKIAFDFGRAGIALVVNYINNNGFHEYKYKRELDEMGLKHESLFKLKDKAVALYSYVTSEIKSNHILHRTFQHFDPNYLNPNSISTTSKFYHIKNKIVDAGTAVHNVWTKKHMSQNIWKVVDATRLIPTKGGEIMKRITTSKNSWFMFPHQARSAWHAAAKHIKRSAITRAHKNRPRLQKILNINTTIPDPNSILCPDPESPLCIKCVALDNLLEITRTHAIAYGTWMSESFGAEVQSADPVSGIEKPGILYDVMTYFGDPGGATETKDWAREATILLERPKHVHHRKLNSLNLDVASVTYDAAINSKIIERYTIVADDWQNLSSTYLNKYFLNETWGRIFERDCGWGQNYSNHTMTNLNNKFITSVQRLLTEKDEHYVPFFGYSITYIVSMFLAGICDVENSIWIQGGSQAERLLTMDQAFIVCIIITLILLFNSVWSLFPLTFLVNVTVIIGLNFYLWMYMVYGYYPSCYPAMPYTLIEDLSEWIHLRLAPGCMCDFFPETTFTWCQPTTCATCFEQVPKYLDCTALDVSPGPIMRELGILWGFPFLLRWVAPTSISWIAEEGYIDSAEWPGLYQLLFDAFSNPDGTTALEKECFRITILDFFIVVVILASGGYLLLLIITAIFNIIVNILVWLWQWVILSGFIATAIEQTTRIGLDESEENENKFSG